MSVDQRTLDKLMRLHADHRFDATRTESNRKSKGAMRQKAAHSKRVEAKTVKTRPVEVKTEDIVLSLGTRTIYSCDDNAERAKLEVPLQRLFTGSSDVLTSEEADTPLADLGMQGILSRTNAIFGTTRILSSMEALLRFCLDNATDFGQAYAFLHPRWRMDPSEALADIETRMKEDQSQRAAAMKNNVVVEPFCRPRRLWDLKSNRVVPFWVTDLPYKSTSKEWFAVSHSWVSDDLRHGVDSPINGHEWPVPIPTDTTLDRIRVELLNLAAHAKNSGPFISSDHLVYYVWLDALCLRQIGSTSKEDLRKKEWKLDVPTIGPIYRQANFNVYYFIGLGRPFEASGLDSPRHWKNRAWTLQEASPLRIIGGRSHHSPSMPDYIHRDSPVADTLTHLHDVFEMGNFFSTSSGGNVLAVLDVMRHRSATSELDKIAGLVFFFTKFKPPLPAYIQDEDPEDAWNRLIEASIPWILTVIFLFFPDAGEGKYAWYPTWQQIKEAKLLREVPEDSHISPEVKFDGHYNAYSVRGQCLEDCFVEGLSQLCSPKSRRGTVRVKDLKGKEHTIPVAAEHSTLIADGHYTLVAGVDWRFRGCIDCVEIVKYLVVVRKREPGFVEKVSTLQVLGDDNFKQKVWSWLEPESTLRLL